MTRPQDAFYQRELVGATGAGLYAVQRELRRLEQAELVVPTPRGNRLYYRANRAHPAFEDLKRLVLKTVGVGDAVRAALSPVADRVQVAWIFGSFARGSETSESDLDICVVGDLTLREVSGLLSEVGRSLGRELNLVLYRPAEFRAKAEAEHHFVSRMIKDKKMYLIGDEHALERLAG